MTNFKNQLYRADCKYIMLDMIDEGVEVDLIYLDPPFNSSRIYNMIFNGGGISAQSKAFHDTWNFAQRAKRLSFDFVEMINSLTDVPKPFKAFISAWVSILVEGSTEDKKLLNYLMYMTERLILMSRILSKNGSIYLHCDPTASHYIKIIMDGIFGKENFLNEIIWHYGKYTNAAQHFQKNHDVILVYCKKIGNHHFNKQFVDGADSTKKDYERGYRRHKPQGMPQLLVYDKSKAKNAIAQAEADNCKIVYREGQTKVAASDVWDIPKIGSTSKERRGYPTQKPVALLKRVVKASSNEGGIVFDPFCGCGTTIAACIELNRNWIGVDISGDACNEIESRIAEMKQVNRTDGVQYRIIESNPETMREYNRLNPYEKQDWLIRKIGGFPNPRKSGDAGVDGEKTIHIGGNKFSKMIFSVKTGKQSKPEFIRELLGTMQQENAVMGGLILDADPSQKMEENAEKAGKFVYRLETEPDEEKGNIVEQEFNKIQIITSQEIIDGKYFIHPPTLVDKKNAEKHTGSLL